MNKKVLILSIALLSLLFIIAPFHSQANIGGLGLNLPFNITVWLSAILFISVVIIASARLPTLIYSRSLLYCLIFPIVVIIAGFVSEVPQATVWFFRQLYILGGFLFLFSLLQLRLSVKQIDQLLYVLVLSTFLHSLVGVAQLFNLTELRGWIPIGNKQLPIGIFQQVNVQATYLVTGLGIILYLISRPSFNASKIVTKSLFILTFGLAVYVIVSTGSRIGILSLILMTLLMLLSRKKYLLRHKKIMLGIVLVSIFSVIAGQSGFLRALDKTEKMTEGEYSSARLTMYAIAEDLIRNKPLLGYNSG
ncbi:MAG: O-antigen ligase family protein [Gammaproteobacteria bacterium]|nr:O-antigen ligase family protein [Gammaproteobacteria bacterium]